MIMRVLVSGSGFHKYWWIVGGGMWELLFPSNEKRDSLLSFLFLFAVCIMNKVIMVLLLEFCSVVVTTDGVVLVW